MGHFCLYPQDRQHTEKTVRQADKGRADNVDDNMTDDRARPCEVELLAVPGPTMDGEETSASREHTSPRQTTQVSILTYLLQSHINWMAFLGKSKENKERYEDNMKLQSINSMLLVQCNQHTKEHGTQKTLILFMTVDIRH